ncbi:MAG: hypothetical protein MSH19_05125 [Methanobrevibacter smithii]|nr:hypothetical protein [Methanobrevibacter smithii]MCI7355476.1 hypothetical protein [Methanobrevibacter smithii]
MGPIDVVAIVILIVAILVLVYYYLQNNPASVQKLRNYVPATADPHMDEILQNDSDYDDLSREKDTVEESKEESMSKRIKIKLSDIDMSGLNTDAFSNKIDAFLDEKSEELIQSWSLATTNDLKDLEDRFDKTTQSVDDLEKSFKKFKKSSKAFQKETEEKLEEIDKRIKSLEDN